jgi:hypothetical protein
MNEIHKTYRLTYALIITFKKCECMNHIKNMSYIHNMMNHIVHSLKVTVQSGMSINLIIILFLKELIWKRIRILLA